MAERQLVRCVSREISAQNETENDQTRERSENAFIKQQRKKLRGLRNNRRELIDAKNKVMQVMNEQIKYMHRLIETVEKSIGVKNRSRRNGRNSQRGGRNRNVFHARNEPVQPPGTTQLQQVQVNRANN